jgi:hypothetical protein
MLRIRYFSAVNQIQMKSMKVIYNKKNISNREWRHNGE